MDEIIIATTPSFTCTFNVVDVANVVEAYLTFKCGNHVIIEKSLPDAEVGSNDLTWTLTQEETLSLKPGICNVMLNFKLADGTTRGASNERSYMVKHNHIEEVI